MRFPADVAALSRPRDPDDLAARVAVLLEEVVALRAENARLTRERDRYREIARTSQENEDTARRAVAHLERQYGTVARAASAMTPTDHRGIA